MARKIYSNIKILSTPNDFEDAINLGQLYIEKEKTVIDTPEHYELCSVQDGTAGLKIVADGSLTDETTEIELTTVNSKLLDTDTHTYAENEYVELVAEVNHIEKYNEEKYARKDSIPEGSTTMEVERLDELWGKVTVLPYAGN